MRLALLLVAACCLMGVAAAQNDTTGNMTGGAGDAASFTLLAELMDGEYVWVDLDGNENPTLRVLPNSEATIYIQPGESAGDVPHNIQVGGGEKSDQISAPGDAASVTFHTPPAGSLTYVCTIHPTTMKGTIEITEDLQESSGGGNGVPAPGALAVLGLAALAALALRRWA